MDAIKKVGDFKIVLYLVVPPEIFPRVGFQNYIKGKKNDVNVKDDMLNLPQFKLELPWATESIPRSEVSASRETASEVESSLKSKKVSMKAMSEDEKIEMLESPRVPESEENKSPLVPKNKKNLSRRPHSSLQSNEPQSEKRAASEESSLSSSARVKRPSIKEGNQKLVTVPLSIQEAIFESSSSSVAAVNEVILPEPPIMKPFTEDEVIIFKRIKSIVGTNSKGGIADWTIFHSSWILAAKLAKYQDPKAKVFNRSREQLRQKNKTVNSSL